MAFAENLKEKRAQSGLTQAELAMKAAAKVIGKNSGADQDLSLYDQFIEEAGDPDDSDRR